MSTHDLAPCLETEAHLASTDDVSSPPNVVKNAESMVKPEPEGGNTT